jgi:lipoprotein-releasing system ATP-binding protein
MTGPLITAQKIDKSYATAAGVVSVLRGLDLEVAEGEMLAITGASGVGKSTLLHILGTLDRADSGKLLFSGEDLAQMPETHLREFRNRSLGFVFQFHHLLPEFSALENVMMPGLVRGLRFDEMRERAARILGEVGLAERLDHRVGKLSGGERQRVAVARALVLDPQLVLADEPTGNLDPATGDRIGELLLEMNRSRGMALVVVTHNERLAERLGRTVVLKDGVLSPAAPATNASKSR